MVGFWFGAGALILLAMGLLLVPYWRQREAGGTRSLSVTLVVLAIVPVSLALYSIVSTYEDYDEAAWRQLGNDYRLQGDYSRARMAYEEAWRLADSPDDGLKLSYAEMMLYTDPSTAQGLAGDLIEEVLERQPTNVAALWLGGVVAVERGQRTEAAERLTAFLATNPPADIATIVREQLMALIGSPVSAGVSAGQGTAVAAADGPVIDIEVTLADEISLDRFGPSARVFLFARAPGTRQPIAADQRLLSEIPGRFSLSDANAMLGGSLGQFESLTVVARISASGTATEQPGDVYAEATVAPGSGEVVHLVLDRVVPEG